MQKKESELKQAILQVETGRATLVSAQVEQQVKFDSLPQLLTQREKQYAYHQTVEQWSEHGQKIAELSQSLQENQAAETQQTVELAKSKEALVVALAHVKQKKSDWASLQIARLSMDLIPGEACPVCGSLEHPAPHTSQTWSGEEIKRAELELEQAEKELEVERKLVVQLEEKGLYLAENQVKLNNQYQVELTWLKEHLLESETSAELQEAIEAEAWPKLNQGLAVQLIENQGKLAELTLEIQAGEAAAEFLTEQQEKVTQLESQLSNLKQSEAELSRELLKAETTLVHLSQQVPEQWTSVAELEAYQGNISQVIDTWEVAQAENQARITEIQQEQLVCQTNQQHYQGELETENQRLAKLRAQVDEAIAMSEYDYQRHQLVALLPQLSEIPRLKNQLVEFKERQQQAKLAYQQLSEKIGAATEPDLAPLQAEIAELEIVILNLEREMIQEEQRLATNQTLGKQVKDQQGKLADQWQDLADLNQLSEVANGDGPYNKKSLERYVLQAYFEEVLRVANERLIQLTGNRYSFELNEAQGSYKSQTGLEINVYDDNVGAVRSVNTLSGGESFIAALALSLSLAEVVQNQAGGVQIEAMFIDEGFGALDEEALEMAMDALELIEGKGRMIGIISHVRELKQRIPQQLKVIASGTGTSQIDYQTELE